MELGGIKMKKSWILTIVIFFIAVISIILFYTKIINIDELSAFGSIFAAAGSLIAIVWFYNSLKQQSIQLNEQRVQFQLEFNNLRLEAKRSVIAIVKTILDDMEIKVSNSLKDVGKLEDLPTLFLSKVIPYLKPISESKNYETVMDAITKCSLILTPARLFLSLMKDAGIIFLDNEGMAVIDDNGQPEWFIITYQEHLNNKPFISRYLPTAILLAEFMVKIDFKALSIAGETSMALMKPNCMKEDKILKDVLEYKEKNNYLPKIAEEWLKTNNIAKKSNEV